MKLLSLLGQEYLGILDIQDGPIYFQGVLMNCKR